MQTYINTVIASLCLIYFKGGKKDHNQKIDFSGQLKQLVLLYDKPKSLFFSTSQRIQKNLIMIIKLTYFYLRYRHADLRWNVSDMPSRWEYKVDVRVSRIYAYWIMEDHPICYY